MAYTGLLSQSRTERRTVCLNEKEFIEKCDTLDLVLATEWLKGIDSSFSNIQEWLPYNGFHDSSFKLLDNNPAPPFGRQVLIGFLGYHDNLKEYLINLNDCGTVLSGMLVHSENEFTVIPSPPFEDYGGKQISFMDTTFTDIEYKKISLFSSSHLLQAKVYLYYADDKIVEQHFFIIESVVDSKGQIKRMSLLDRFIQLSGDDMIPEHSLCSEISNIIVFDDHLKK